MQTGLLSIFHGQRGLMQAPCCSLQRMHNTHGGRSQVRALSQPFVLSESRWTARHAHRHAHRQTAARRRHSVVLGAATEVTEAGKEISRVEIPAFIPRPDLLEQLVRWALGNASEDGAANFGLPMRVEPFRNSKDDDWGFIVSIVRDGVTLTQVAVMFDEELTERSEWVGRGADGFPVQEGKTIEVVGKNLIIRKLDDSPVDEELRSCIRRFCEELMSALNKYYAFGSCFVDDYT